MNLRCNWVPLCSFGLSLKRVLDAIKNDFGKSADQVGRTVHPIERTQLLTIVVDGLLPVGGPARVKLRSSEYESKSLSQINVAWGQLANSETSQERFAGGRKSAHWIFLDSRIRARANDPEPTDV